MTITGDVFLFFMGILALILMGMSQRNILFALSSSMVWFSLFFWLFFSDTPPLDITKSWVQILTYVFFILALVPWIIRMDVEIKKEAKGQGAWHEWGPAPQIRLPSRRQDYQKMLRKRLSGK